MRIVLALFIAFSILRGYLAFASVNMPPKKRKGRVRFRHRNRERKRNRRASLTKNGLQNWQRATKAHFISKRSGSRSWIFRKAKMLQLLRVQAAPKSSLKNQMKKANYELSSSTPSADGTWKTISGQAIDRIERKAA